MAKNASGQFAYDFERPIVELEERDVPIVRVDSLLKRII